MQRLSAPPAMGREPVYGGPRIGRRRPVANAPGGNGGAHGRAPPDPPRRTAYPEPIEGPARYAARMAAVRVIFDGKAFVPQQPVPSSPDRSEPMVIADGPHAGEGPVVHADADQQRERELHRQGRAGRLPVERRLGSALVTLWEWRAEGPGIFLLWHENAAARATVTLDQGKAVNQPEPITGFLPPSKTQPERLGVNVADPVSHVVMHTLIVPIDAPARTAAAE